MPEQHREHQQLLFYTPKNCSERLSGNVAILLIRQALFVNLARAEVSKPLDGLKLNGIGTLQ